MYTATSNYCSIWLKPMLKCLDKIIDCKKPKLINYREIQTGSIVMLEFRDSNNKIHERTYVATSNWDKNAPSGSFLNLHGKQVVLSARILKNLNVCVIGSLEV